MQSVGRFLAGFTELGLMLIALSVIAVVVFGPDIPFIGGITEGFLGIVKQLGDAGLVGLIGVGILAWLVTKKA
ncbi:MAG: hypothetical protein HOH80_01540 [Rhodospirillaceae bacterium]|jgi:hypothetical protein|nr:hypothetical protein [Rhodospirillaceae bacterium]MBT4117507.1 hypothetical protein [Rhodospirillaceae bacterium]MBT4672089.1 hypothetical protein [Rhodospirillaceae bacterium]MBT4719680.1 hypothetical protein [Rhodospirillaceae bacterium]MBT5179061.1 hypothetical protein [Rhodospirillaceae bacterium]